MTDLEITKLCALAMGFTHYKVSHDRHSDKDFVEIVRWPDDGNGGEYDPLHNDEQAMALVKKLELGVIPMASRDRGWNVEHYDDPYARVQTVDLNRAIVECAAKIQEAKASVP